MDQTDCVPPSLTDSFWQSPVNIPHDSMLSKLHGTSGKTPVTVNEKAIIGRFTYTCLLPQDLTYKCIHFLHLSFLTVLQS